MSRERDLERHGSLSLRQFYLDEMDDVVQLVASGERVEVCDSHVSMWLNDEDGCEAVVAAQVKPWRNPCRKVSKVLIDPPEEE